MARKNNLIELTLEVKRKGTEQIGKYKKQLFDLKKAANDLNKTLNATQKQLSKDVQNTSVKALSKDSEKAQAQIKKLEAALTKVTQELKEQKKAQSDLRKESNAKIQAVTASAKAEIKAYKDAEKALKRKKKVQDDADKSNKKSVTSLQALGNAAATVNGPLNDISGRINSLATGLKNFDKGLIALGTGFAALAFALPGALRSFSEMESQLLRIDGLLKQTGNSSGFTTQQFEDMAQELAFNTLASLTEVRDSIGLLLSFPNIRTENFERVLELSQDIAEVTRRDLKSATEQVAKAVTDPIKGITKLTEVGVVFTEEQENLIKSTQRAEGTFAAQGVILDVLASQYGGSAKRAAQGFAGVIDTLGQLVENMNTAFGEAAENSAFVNFISDATKGMQLLLDARSYGGAKEFLERLEQLRKGSITLNQALNDIDKTIGRIQDEQIQNIGIDIASEDQEGALEKLAKRQKEELDKTIDEISDLRATGQEVPKELIKQAEQQAANITETLVETRKQISAAFEFQTGEIGEKLVGKQGLQRSKQELEEFANLAKRAGINIDEIELSDGVISKPLVRELSETERELTELRKKGVQEAGRFGKTYTEEQKKRITELKKRYDELYLQLGNAAAAQIRNLQEGGAAIADAGANVSQLGLKAAIDSATKAKEEQIQIEQERKDELKRLREESAEELEIIEKRKRQSVIDIRLEALNRQERLDADNVDIKENKLRLKSEKEIISLEVRRLELVKQRKKALNEIEDVRKKEFPEKTDEEIEKFTANTDKPFTRTLSDLEKTNKEIDLLDTKIKETKDSLSEEIRIIVELNQQKIDEQINTILEDTSIKQKELISRLQGDTEESLENQLSVIDEKYDKILNNIEERFGEIPSNIAKELSDEKALEKANATFDNVNKRFKALNEELKEGKISVDSYVTSVNELNKTLKQTGEAVNVDIKLKDPLEGLQDSIKPKTDEAADDIQKILDRVEDADLSEGFELRKSALDRLREYSQELIRIKELNPEIDISDAVKQIKDLEKQIKNTYTLTEKIFKDLANDFSSTFADGIKEMATEGGRSLRSILKESIAEAFGNYAANRLRDLVFNGIQAGLEKLGSDAISNFFTELDFGDYFGGGDDNAIDYNKLEDTFIKSMEINNNKSQDVRVTNPNDIKQTVSGGGGDSGLGALSGLASSFLSNVGGGEPSKEIVKIIDEKDEPENPYDGGQEGNERQDTDQDKDFKDFIKNNEEANKDLTDTLKDIFGKEGGGSGAAGATQEGAGFLAYIKSFFTKIIEFFKGLIPGLDGLLSTFKGLLGGAGGFGGILDSLTSSLGSLGDVFNSLLGSFGGAGSFFSGLFSGAGSFLGGIFHTGGMVGEGGGSPIAMSESMLKNAKYFHDGGYTGSKLKSDEMAAILQKGEYVIDKQTTKNLLNNGGSSNQGRGVNITNTFGNDDIALGLTGNRIAEDNIVNTIKARANEINQYLNR